MRRRQCPRELFGTSPMTRRFGPSPRRMSALLGASVLLALAAGGGADAQFDPLRKPLSPQKLEAARSAAHDALIVDSAIKGPATLEADAATVIDLPAGFSFVPGEAAKSFAQAEGNSSENVVGLLFPDSEASGAIMIEYVGGPHAADDGDKASSPEGWKATFERSLTGTGGARVGAFASEPAYDPQKHRFTLGANFTAADGSGASAGSLFEAFQFGREGYLRMKAPAAVPLDQRRLDAVTRALDAVRFKAGQTYTDYDVATAPASALTVADVISPAPDREKARTTTFAERLEASGILKPLLFLFALGALGVVASLGWIRLSSMRLAQPARMAPAGGSAMTRFDQLNKNKPT